ncbi:transmembrane protein 53-B isoform X2 [Anthonomus grandis grandis]|nr:transmembrane protein 53-B isoform X2 [Anthonomus grandis grandis]
MSFSHMARFLKQGFQNLSRGNMKNSQKFLLGFMIMPVRNISCLEINKNLSLLSNEKIDTTVTNFKLNQPQENPLVILLAWMMAKKNHTRKYADIWIQKGFDVLCVTVSPWQFLWPVKGTQLVALDILKFIEQNESYAPIVLHGFSVGGYLWGEVMVHMSQDKERYQAFLDRFAGQVWDSAADLTEIHKGVPPAVFPRNKVMAKALGKYILYHMKTFDKVATRHYVRSSQMFHTNMCRAPALFLISKTDPIGAVDSNQRVRESWESMGMKVDWKVFEKSAHVGHFRKYPKEYVAEIHDFLTNINMNKDVRQKETERPTDKIKINQ